MAISDATAIKFSNEHIRTSADRLSRRYYTAQAISDKWNALGGGQSALDALRESIYGWCNDAADYHVWNYHTNRRWEAFGRGVIPDTPDAVSDMSPRDGRPPNTGAKSNSLMSCASEAIGDWEDNSFAKLNDALAVAKGEPADITLAVGVAAIDLMDDVITGMELANNAKLNDVLALAVNTGAPS